MAGSSVDEISEYLAGVSKDTVYTWISAMGVPAHRIGRLRKFNRDKCGLSSNLAARPIDTTTQGGK
jgi:excisionase family DNA binding protein